MAQRADFWKGVIAGTLAGMAIAAYIEWDFSVGKEILQELKSAGNDPDVQDAVTGQSGDELRAVS
jgi:hypothetical protein